MCWNRQLLLKLLFRKVFKMISDINFKCGSINFPKQRKYSVKYQELGIIPLSYQAMEDLSKDQFYHSNNIFYSGYSDQYGTNFIGQTR